MNPTLIYDVGMNDGDDTAYYLHKGFNVVAIEADPDLIAAAQMRFSEEVKSGKLILVHTAIAAEPGEAEFWICDNLRVWNSFDKAVASRDGHSCHPIRVKTLPLREHFGKHGVPYYLKIDIEGYDAVAAADISVDDPPKYVSMEIGSVDDFFLLRQKGYKRFKCIQQGYFRQVLSPRIGMRSTWQRQLEHVKTSRPINYLRGIYHKHLRASQLPVSEGAWKFSPGSSGPFGDTTDGEWQTFDAALHAWLSQTEGASLGYRLNPLGLEDWYDLHATL